MMPTIRIDDDVLNGLKALAEPFVDTPNSVIRTLLQERGVLSKQGPEAPPADAKPESKVERTRESPPKQSTDGLTPQSVYELFLLHVLAEKSSGSASKREATQRVVHLMKSHGFIGPADL